LTFDIKDSIYSIYTYMNVSMKQAILHKILPIMAGALFLSACGKEAAQSAQSAPSRAMEVEVIPVKLESLAWKETYPARVEGMRRAEVRPRVSGIIVKRLYEEGSFVEEGAVLFQIDPVPYELAVEKAKAELARAAAQARQTARDRDRVTRLFETGAVSEKQRDDAISAFELAEAGELSAQAALRQAELNLDYTKVTAPVSGVTGMEVLTEGSLVSSADKLTTVTQLDPIYVQFSLPEGDPAYQQLFARGSRQKEGSTALTLFTRNGSEYGRPGQVNFSETGVDPQTGSVRMRAQFENADSVLLPGQFARIAFKDLNLAPCAVIPEAAVLMTARAPIVYVVNGENKVEPRPVMLGPVVDGGQMIVAGLAEGDRVIITSLIRIRPGMTVVPRIKGSEAAR
jgi:membrane fusion protein (multidrug efflux system)